MIIKWNNLLLYIVVMLLLISSVTIAQDTDQDQDTGTDPVNCTDSDTSFTAHSQLKEQIPKTGTKQLSDKDISTLNQILLQLKRLHLNYEHLNKQIAKHDGLIKRLFETRLEKNRQQILDDSIKFLTQINTLQKADFNVDDYWIRATTIAHGLTQIVSHALEMTIEHNDNTDGSKNEVQAEGQFFIDSQLEEDSKRADEMLNLVIKNINLLDHFGVDINQSREVIKNILFNNAEMRSVFLELSISDLHNINTQLQITPGDTKLTTKQKEMANRISLVVDALTRTVDMMEVFNMDVNRFKAQLVESSGNLSEDILDASVVSVLFKSWVAKIEQWFAENGVSIGFKILLFMVILLVAWLLSRLTHKIVEKLLRNPKIKFSRLLKRMVISFSQNIILLIGLLIALAQLGFSIGPVLAGLGVAGFIVGFALQDTLSNFASGMMILLYRPFDVGDLLEAGGVFGFVNNMSLVNTTILTLDNQTLIVPNNKIWGDIIKNVTAQKIRRVDMKFGISYSDDVAKTEETLKEIIDSCDKVLKTPAPMIHLHELGDSSINFIVRPWSKTDDYWDVYWEITRKVKIEFDKNDISIPFPQQDVHIYNTSDKD